MILESAYRQGGFFGYKVFLNWLGDDYGDITIEDMLSPVEMKIADKYNLWILEDACHAPGGYFIDSNDVKQYCGNGVYSDLHRILRE